MSLMSILLILSILFEVLGLSGIYNKTEWNQTRTEAPESIYFQGLTDGTGWRALKP